MFFLTGNALACLILLGLFERRTRTVVYWLTRLFDGKTVLIDSSLPANHISEFREKVGMDGVGFFEEKPGGGWLMQVLGYSSVPVAGLARRLQAPLSLSESIVLFGAQPCFFFAKASRAGLPGDWFGEFRQYVLALDGAIWRRTTQSFVAFQDHTCVNRLVSLRQAVRVFYKELAQPENQKIYRIVQAMQSRDRALLLDEHLFDSETNHGLLVCRGLLLYGLDVPPPLRTRLVAKVSRWMRSREDFFISDDGVVLEISQTYWRLIYMLFREIEDLFSQLGAPVVFSKLKKTEDFFEKYSIDHRVNRFGDSALGHDLQLALTPKRPTDGVTCRIFDTGLLVVDFAAGGRVLAQLVLNSQDIHPWVHGQESQMAMGFFFDDVFWVDSPGRYTSGKKGIKAKIDNFRNQSVPVRRDSGYVSGWRFEQAEKHATEVVLSFTLNRKGRVFLKRDLTVGQNGGFSVHDAAPDGVVETRFLLPPQAEVNILHEALTVTASGHQAVFNFSGQPSFVDGLISFARNVVQPAKVFCLSDPQVKFSWVAPHSFSGDLHLEVSPNYPYRKRLTRPAAHPACWLRLVSVKKLLVAVALAAVLDASWLMIS